MCDKNFFFLLALIFSAAAVFLSYFSDRKLKALCLKHAVVFGAEVEERGLRGLSGVGGSWLSEDMRMMSLADTHRHSLWSAVMCQDGHQHSRGCSGYRPRLSARMPTQTAQCLVLGEEAWLFWHPTPPRVIWLLLCCLQGLCGGRCTASVCFCQEKITPKLSCWVPTWPSGLTQQNWWVPSDNPLRHSERSRGINSLQGRGVAPSEEDMQKSPHQSAREAVCFWAALSGSLWHLHRPGVDKIAATPENRT